jgi:arylsulfatase A-like enzyme
VRFLHAAPADRPFCLAVSFKAPHVQDEGRALPGIYPKYPYDLALQPLYANASVPPPMTADAAPLPAFFDRTLNRIREAEDFHPDPYQEAMKALYRLLSGVDIAVGRIRSALRDIGAADNTVILYTSDHGSFYGEHGFGGKWLGMEESIRTPMILFDPRHAPPQANRVCQEMVLNIDVAPTLLDLAGVPIPLPMQGRSLVPLARGQAQSPRQEWFYEHPFGEHHTVPIAPSEGIRTGRWKYLRYIESDPLYEQLFDLQNDPREERNLAGNGPHQALLQQLRSRWMAWRAALDHAKPNQRWVDPV